MTNDRAPSKPLLVLPPIFFLTGLLALYIGERALSGISRGVVSGLGVLTLVGLALAFVRVSASDAQRRAAAVRLTIEYGVCLLALVLYGLQLEEVGLVDGDLRTVVRVIWPAILLLALIPALAMEMALFSMRRAPQLELWRMRFAGRGARIVALAIIAFAGLNYAANQWNRKIDLSYFKTTRPGSSTTAMLADLNKPVRFVLFFPPGNDVLEQVREYAETLAATSDLATVEIADQALDPELAREMVVRANGYLAIHSEGKTESIRLGLDVEDARGTLRDLDGKVQQKLFKVLRPPRIAYFTTGHLERDYVRAARGERLGLRDFRTMLEMLGFQIKRLGLGEGLGSEVPEDALLVVVPGPLEPFLPEERATLERYMKRGGRLLLLVDPDHGTTEDELLALLGVRVTRALVANDRHRVRVPGRGESPYDLVTTRASSHPSVETLSKSGGRLGTVLLGAGSVHKTDEPPPEMKTTFTLRTMEQSWLDKNGNRRFDEGSEKRESLDFAAAIERTGSSGDSMRAVVVADADIAGDGLVGNPGNGYFLRDCVRWLAGDEETAGTVETEKDEPIVHKKDEDAIWFYGTSILMPLVILGLGLWISLFGRRRSS